MNKATKTKLISAAWTIGAALVASIIWVAVDGAEKTRKAKAELKSAGEKMKAA